MWGWTGTWDAYSHSVTVLPPVTETNLRTPIPAQNNKVFGKCWWVPLQGSPFPQLPSNCGRCTYPDKDQGFSTQPLFSHLWCSAMAVVAYTPLAGCQPPHASHVLWWKEQGRSPRSAGRVLANGLPQLRETSRPLTINDHSSVPTRW